MGGYLIFFKKVENHGYIYIAELVLEPEPFKNQNQIWVPRSIYLWNSNWYFWKEKIKKLKNWN